MTVKTFIMLQKINIYQRIPKKILSSTAVFNIANNNNKCFLSNNSEGSCDTEGWSNDTENPALHHRNKLHIQIYSNRKFYIVIIFCNIAVFTVFLIRQMQPW